MNLKKHQLFSLQYVFLACVVSIFYNIKFVVCINYYTYYYVYELIKFDYYTALMTLNILVFFFFSLGAIKNYKVFRIFAKSFWSIKFINI